ncbi:MAG: hypothetical protein ACXVA8_14060 [Bdellovibrionota bacterium]
MEKTISRDESSRALSLVEERPSDVEERPSDVEERPFRAALRG